MSARTKADLRAAGKAKVRRSARARMGVVDDGDAPRYVMMRRLVTDYVCVRGVARRVSRAQSHRCGV